jgi:hypothetical protein
MEIEMINIIKKFNVKENSAFPHFDYFNQLAKEISSDSRVEIFSDGISRNGKELKAFSIGTGNNYFRCEDTFILERLMSAQIQK